MAQDSYQGNYEAWMRDVDRALSPLGITHHELADALYRDNFDAGVSPVEMAREAVANDDLFAMFGEEVLALI